MFATATGEPLNPNTDCHEWKQLLKDAGLRETRLHDARHTAATVLLILGVPVRTVMSLMGWSSSEMAARYQHVTDAIRHDVARQVDPLIWQTGSARDIAPPDAQGRSGAAADETVPVDRPSLAAIMSLAELGLVHADVATIASTRPAVEQIRALLAEGARASGPDGAQRNEREAR